MDKINDFSELRSLVGEPGGAETFNKKGKKSARSSNRKGNLKPKRENQSQGPQNPPKSNRKKRSSGSQNLSHLVFKRKVKVYCWNVKATIALLDRRDDLMPVLKRALENDGTHPKDVAGHLLGEEVGREVVGRRLLDSCTGLGLLEKRGEQQRPRYFLTENGHKALEAGSVLVPEEGTWTIWACNDPLLDYPILRVEPYNESSAFDEVHGNKKQEARDRNDGFERFPKWLEASLGKVSRPSAVGTKEIRLDSIGSSVDPVADHSDLEIIWTPEARGLNLNGNLSGSDVHATPPAPKVSFDDVWRELLKGESLWDSWAQEANHLLVSFDQTESSEREPMQRNLKFSKPNLAKYGSFEPTSRRVEIFPATESDAQAWAEWKLKNRINTYAIESDFFVWREQSISCFGDYGNALTLPARSELAGRIWSERQNQEKQSRTWHLMAVEDWGI